MIRTAIKARVRKLEAVEQEAGRPSVVEILEEGRARRLSGEDPGSPRLWWPESELAAMTAAGGWQARIAAARRRVMAR
jgi:hypothetical protein